MNASDAYPGRRLRCALVLAVGTVAAGAVVAAALPAALDGAEALLAPRRLASAGFEELLVWLCAAIAVPVTGWCWVVTVVTVADVLGRHAPTTPAASGAGTVRRLVLLACGVALASGTATAHAGPPRPADPTTAVAAPQHVGRGGVDGLPLPDRPTGGPAPADVRRDAVVVRAGDSLWAIAARALPDGAGADVVGRYWHRIHDLNRDVIGPDPDVVLPGQRLDLPGRERR